MLKPKYVSLYKAAEQLKDDKFKKIIGVNASAGNSETQLMLLLEAHAGAFELVLTDDFEELILTNEQIRKIHKARALDSHEISSAIESDIKFGDLRAARVLGAFCNNFYLAMRADDVDRLLEQKQPAQANHSPADTVENLQQQLNDALATIAELQKEPAPKSKTTINIFFKALNKAYPNLDVPRIIANSDDDISDKVIYKYLKDGI